MYAEAKLTSTELARTRQYSGEDLDEYVKRFNEKALDCCDPVVKMFWWMPDSIDHQRLSSIS